MQAVGKHNVFFAARQNRIDSIDTEFGFTFGVNIMNRIIMCFESAVTTALFFKMLLIIKR